MLSDIIEIVKKMISIKSLSYHEMEIAEYISSLLHEKGIPHIFDKFNAGDYMSAPHTDLPITANIYVEVGQGRETLMIYTHTDVVDAKKELFEPVIKNGKIYGRGASDMKSSVAGLLYFLLHNYNKLKNAKKKIIFSFIADEETSATGIKRCVEWIKSQNVLDLSCIIMEPTDDFTKLENGGKGYCFLDIEGNMNDVISSFNIIRESKDKILSRYPDKGDGFGAPTLELTKISCLEKVKDENIQIVKGKSNHASRPNENGAVNALEMALKDNKDISYIVTGDSEGPNTIPATAFFINCNPRYNKLQCKANIDLRTNLAANKNDDLLNNVIKILSNKLKVITRDFGRAFKTTDERLISICEDAAGQKVSVQLAKGGNDAPYLLELTDKIVIFGPGEKRVIHTEEEFVEISVLEKTPQVIDNIINKYLNSTEAGR